MKKAAPKVPKESKEQAAATAESDVDDIMEEGRLFIRNLPYSCTEEEIRDYAKQFGDIVDIFIHNLKRYAEGLPLDNQVNRTTLYAADQNGGHRLLSTL